MVSGVRVSFLFPGYTQAEERLGFSPASWSADILSKADANPAMSYTRASLPAPYIVGLTRIAEMGLEFHLAPFLFC